MPESVQSSTPEPPSKAWSKVDIIHHLADLHGYRSYLEICSSATGGRYAEIDRSMFDTRHRLMYRCPDDFSDGLAIDFRSRDLDIAQCLDTILRKKLRYNIILVDSWHAYDTSYRDLAAALRLIADHGAVVVHDCLPPREEITVPDYISGEWCGVTYKAYVDFVSARSRLRYCTVDTDYGCGVIRKTGWWSRIGRWLDGGGRKPDALVREWQSIGQDFDRAWRFFEKNHQALLKLISVEEFVRLESARATRGQDVR
jgi:hypothetical protein